MPRTVRSPVDYSLLEALERFRLLTIGQGVRLGLANYRHVAERFRLLTSARLVHMTARGRLAGPHVFCLSQKGAETLAVWREDGLVPSYRKAAYEDTTHLTQRVLTVDLHITLRAWASLVGATVEWVRASFDGNPLGMFPATALEHQGRKAEPDLIAALASIDGRHWLVAFEVETGGRSHRLTNFNAHLEERIAGLKARVLEYGCDWPQASSHKSARLVFVFETPEMLARAMGRVQRTAEPEWKRVLFGVLPTSPEAFNRGWLTADGAEGPFLPLGSP